jgi:hypothetical protein
MHGIDELERAPRIQAQGGQHADKRSHASPGLDARGTTKAGLDQEGVTGLADRQ